MNFHIIHISLYIDAAVCFHGFIWLCVNKNERTFIPKYFPKWYQHIFSFSWNRRKSFPMSVPTWNFPHESRTFNGVSFLSQRAIWGQRKCVKKVMCKKLKGKENKKKKNNDVIRDSKLVTPQAFQVIFHTRLHHFERVRERALKKLLRTNFSFRNKWHALIRWRSKN